MAQNDDPVLRAKVQEMIDANEDDETIRAFVTDYRANKPKEMGAPQTPEQIASQRENLAKYKGPSTFTQGVMDSILQGDAQEASARGAGGFLKGAISDIPANLVALPGHLFNLVTDPVGTVEQIPDVLAGMWDTTLRAGSEPEEFGRMMGNITGQPAVTGRFGPPVLRSVGRGLGASRVGEMIPNNVYGRMGPAGVGLDTRGIGAGIGRGVNSMGRRLNNLGARLQEAGDIQIGNSGNLFKPPVIPRSSVMHEGQIVQPPMPGFAEGVVIPEGFGPSIEAAYQGTPLQLPAAKSGLPPGGIKVHPNATKLLKEGGRPAIQMPGEIAPIDMGMQSPSVARGTHVPNPMPAHQGSNRALPAPKGNNIPLGPAQERVTINAPSSAVTKRMKKQGYTLESHTKGRQVWIKPRQ